MNAIVYVFYTYIYFFHFCSVLNTVKFKGFILEWRELKYMFIVYT